MEAAPEDRLDLALRASNEGIWDWMVNEGTVYYSKRNLEFLGCKKEGAPNIFQNPDPWIFHEDLEEFKAELSKVLSPGGEDIFAIDSRYERPDGKLVWLRIRGASVRDDDGNVERIAGSMIEISRRKKAEAALEEERHRLMTLIENIPVNVYFKDGDSKFVMANTATAKKLGAETVENLLGKSDHDFFDVRHANKSRQDEMVIMATGESQTESIEQEIWEEGKEETWVITSKMPWRDRKGNIQGVFGVTSDVSDLVKTQRKLLEMTHELKKRNDAVEEELQLAREIQLSIIQEDQVKSLPEGDSESAWMASVAYRYAPVSGMAGDFYQVTQLDENKVGFFICDVMGHGVRSALIVSMLRGLMEKERDSATSPEWFLYGLNSSLSAILRRAGVTMFATAFYAVLDLNDKSLVYANAGHPSPFVVGEDGVSRLSDHKKVTGPALGLVDECAYASGEISFDQFSKLILFTDGIYETANPDGEEMGIDRLAKVIDKSEDGIERTLDELLEATRDFTGDGEYGDDVCLVGVELIKRNDWAV